MPALGVTIIIAPCIGVSNCNKNSQHKCQRLCYYPPALTSVTKIITPSIGFNNCNNNPQERERERERIFFYPINLTNLEKKISTWSAIKIHSLAAALILTNSIVVSNCNNIPTHSKLDFRISWNEKLLYIPAGALLSFRDEEMDGRTEQDPRTGKLYSLLV